MRRTREVEGPSSNGEDKSRLPMNTTETTNQVREMLELALGAVKDYALILTDKDGLIVAWLAGSEDVLGYRADEIVGKPLSTIFVAEDVERGIPEYEFEVARHRGTSQEIGRAHV